MERPRPVPPEPGQESVWDYPRPPRCERTDALIEIEHDGVLVARTRRSWRVLETSHAPSYYLPPEDLQPGLLVPSGHRPTVCEWKGIATYWSVEIHGELLPDVGWSYAHPRPGFEGIRDHVAFYPDRFDQCSVDGETVTGQPGGFYGGWITSRVVGPFKGAAGSRWW